LNNLTARILVIDDKENIRKLLRTSLETDGYDVEEAEDGIAGVARFRDAIHDLVITDVKMPGMSGLEALEAIKEINPDTAVIVITAFADMDDAIAALKQGAADYLRKPFKLEEIRSAVEKSLRNQKLIIENRLLRREVEEKYKFSQIVATSRPMRDVFDKIHRLAAANSTVLITGDTGTGKELVARAIHFNSPRKAKPFAVVNCAAIPQTLLESELFGHVKGAFTDAYHDKRGRFEDAGGGSLFLDEISEINPATQAKLLRVLQNGEYNRIGDNKVCKADARVIAATNIDLTRAVEEGRFRKDLFFRINVLPIHLPPLRERREDIPLLLRHFRDISCRENNMELKNFTPTAINFLIGCDWPGNVRELRNVVERCCLMSPGTEIGIEDLPSELGPPLPADAINAALSMNEDGVSIKKNISRITEAVEKDLIFKALEKAGGNKELAADLLEVSRRTLFYKLKQYNINTKED
jgi:DNA-binding NtrC family response regulator